MKLNDKLKAEIVAWMNKGIQRGATVPVFEDMVNKLEEETIKHCAKVVGEGLLNKDDYRESTICGYPEYISELTKNNKIVDQAKQRLLNLI